MPLDDLFATPKWLLAAPRWRAPGPETLGNPESLWFRHPLALPRAFRSQVDLQATARRDLPDRQVSFSLILHAAPPVRSVPLARLDWRAITGGHSNPRKGPPDVAGKRVSPTHYHAFDLNYVAEEDRMRRAGLPFAREVDAALPSFLALRTFVGTLFSIGNIDLVPPPDWQGSLPQP